MRRILLTTYGSYGDLHPYIAMALALKSQGHFVTIGTHTHYQVNVERLGIRFLPLKPGQEDLGPEENWIHQSNNPKNGAEFILRQLMFPYLEESYQGLVEEVKNSDLVISHILCFAAPIAAEKFSVPWLSTILQPSTLLSAYDPPRAGQALFLDHLRFLGPNFFKLVVRFAKWQTNRWLDPVHAFREKIGLPKSEKNLLLEGFSPLGNLNLFPSQFASPQPDWPKNSIQLPFPFFDQEESGELSSEVKLFLERGEAPIIFTLGTAIIRLQSDFFNHAYAAVRRLGRRAIFLVGKEPHGVPAAAYTDPQIQISAYEPFSALFPHGLVIVHQCGVGTTAQALRSGRPQVLVPFAHDQPDNARIVESKGLGIGVSVLSEQKIFNALEKVLGDANYAVRAQAFSESFTSQNFDKEFLAAVNRFL